MDVTIEQSCPSCGASIVLNEDDRLIQCAFCDVNNYKVGNQAGRYILPAHLPDRVDENQLIYAPYLRFKGSIFFVRDKEVESKIVDTTRLGVTSKVLPVSLGLRPQAMTIKPVVSATRGTFLLQSIPTKTIFAHAAAILDLFKKPDKQITYHRSFIGETLSCIYQPLYVRDEHLYDAVTNTAIGSRNLLTQEGRKPASNKVGWEPRFITTLCPGCGGLLSGERDSMVLLCRNCQASWQEHEGKFIAVDWQVVASEERDDREVRYLPFWQITLSTKGFVLKSFGDFLRFTNQPLVALPKHDTQALVFWIPAFKINPKAFLQIASQLTVAQARIPEGEKRKVVDGYPVTLEQKEALQAIKSVLANSTLSREKRFSLLPTLKLDQSRSMLTYLPFIAQTHDLVQEHTLATIQTAAIRYGRAL